METKQFENLTEAQKRFIENRITRYRLAKETGLTHKTIWTLWHNKNRATMDTYEKIAKALGLSLSEFFSIKD